MASVTPNMNLTKWDSISDYFSHAQLAANFDAIDDHDHGSGKGTPIVAGGIATGAVNAAALQTDSVIAAKIENGAVTTAKLDTGAVTTGKLATGAATSPKVALTNASAAASATLTLSGSWVDIAGATITFTPSVASTAIITGIFDFQTTASATLLGELQVDGNSETGGAFFAGTASGQRATASQIWIVNLTAASHTIKLRSRYSAGGGTANQTNTKISYILFSQ